MTQETQRVVLALQAIRLEGHHGVSIAERTTGNRFEVDLEWTGRFSAAVASDDLSDTVDYRAMVQVVREINRLRQFNLIESFAGAIADGLLDRFPLIDEICVRVRKLAPPGLGDVSWSAVEIRKKRTSA